MGATAARAQASTDRPRPKPKLKVGHPADPMERAADRIADRVLAMPVPVTASPSAGGPPAQEPPGRAVARAPAQHAGPPLEGTAALDRMAHRSGAPLTEAERGFFEPRFGHDLSRIRIHADGEAAAAASSIGARAYTVGQHVVFGAAQRSGGADGRWLMAHELAHTLQQGAVGSPEVAHADFAVEPTTPGRARRVLTAAEVQAAIAFNRTSITDPQEIGMLRDILGISANPPDVDADFAQAVADYQVQYGLTADGQVGQSTRRRLSQEVLGEAQTVGMATPGGLEPGVRLRNALSALVTAGNVNYADFRAAIQPASALQKDVVLAEPAFLTQLRNHLPWDSFARCVELLGRRAPTFNGLLANAVVQAQLAAAWTASSPGLNPPAGAQHEEGGWIYLNLITNVVSVVRQAPGAGAAIVLSPAPVVADSITVGMFHTHPNMGPGWTAGPSPTDLTLDAADGVPDIVCGTTGIDPAVFTTFLSGPNRRLHLAGNQGLPGAAGGVAPQARKDGTDAEER